VESVGIKKLDGIKSTLCQIYILWNLPTSLVV